MHKPRRPNVWPDHGSWFITVLTKIQGMPVKGKICNLSKLIRSFPTCKHWSTYVFSLAVSRRHASESAGPNFVAFTGSSAGCFATAVVAVRVPLVRHAELLRERRLCDNFVRCWSVNANMAYRSINIFFCHLVGYGVKSCYIMGF